MRTRIQKRLWSMLGVATLGISLAAQAATVSGRVVAPDGKPIEGAVVFVQSQLQSSQGTAARAAMDQIDKTFVPGVLPVVAGTEVRFPNHDQIHHHVYSFSRTKSFELPLYKGQDAAPVLFDKAGVVKIGCNIHDWMSAVILVLPNRHYAVTDTQGRFTLPDLPSGAHTLAAWHELSRTRLDDTLREVRIGADDGVASVAAHPPAADAAPARVASGDAPLSFTLRLAPARTRPAVRGSRKDT